MIITLQRSSLWLSALLHLLLFLSFSVAFVYQYPPQQLLKKEPPSLDVPAYLYREQKHPVVQQAVPQKNVPTSLAGIEKPAPSNSPAVKNANESTSKPVSPASEPIKVNASQKTEPIHLVGGKELPKPLLKLLGKALSAHLVYPKIAVDFKVRGTAIVGFMLSPDGQISNTQLMQSSRADVLDQAAMDGINAMSPVNQVNLYLKEPKFMVVGVIFR